MTAALFTWAFTGLLAACALATWLRQRAFLQRAARATGVLSAVSDRSGEFPVVTFSPDGDLVAGGRTIQVRSNLSTTRHWTLGQQVPIAYERAQPERAVIAVGMHAFVLPFALAMVAIVGAVLVIAIQVLAHFA